jgi:predicted nicotinamide N-methyase
LERVSSSVFNWQQLQQAPSADVVLLSDVNFNPADDDALLRLIEHYLNRGSTVLLSTPERLWAKPFVSQLLPWAIEHQRVVENDVAVSILHLACQKTVRL